MLPVLLLSRRRPADARLAGRDRDAPRVRPSPDLDWAGPWRCYFGLQSLSGYAIMGWLPQIYRDAGFSAADRWTAAGAAIAVGLPIALLMPTLAARRTDQRGAGAGPGGVLAWPTSASRWPRGPGALVWTALLAVGQSAFPLALTLIGLRARTAAGTVALSAFTQSAGYLVAAAGPLVGRRALRRHRRLDGADRVSCSAALVIQVMAGLAAARPRFIEPDARTREIPVIMS